MQHGGMLRTGKETGSGFTSVPHMLFATLAKSTLCKRLTGLGYRTEKLLSYRTGMF